MRAKMTGVPSSLDGLIAVRDGVRRQPWIDQRGSDVLVAAHYPGRLAVPHRPLKAGLFPPTRELDWGRKRALCGAPQWNDG